MKAANDPPPIDIHLIGQTLIDNNCSDSVKLSAIQNLKTVLNTSSQINGNLGLEPLLDSVTSLQNLKKCGKDFLFSYGLSLIDYLGKNISLIPKILVQLELTLFELRRQDENLTDLLIKKLWQSPEHSLNFNQNFLQKILPLSEKLLEEVVLDWFEDCTLLRETNYLVKLSADSPELFQTITAIIYQIILKSQGNSRCLEIMKSFVNSVMSVCERERKDFLSLYPKDSRSLISLLMIPSEIYPEGNGSDKLVTRSLVAGLLSDCFFKNSKRCLMLLSHYPDWLTVLKMHLYENHVWS